MVKSIMGASEFLGPAGAQFPTVDLFKRLVIHNAYPLSDATKNLDCELTR